MQTETISSRQAVFAITLFIVGSSIVIGGNPATGQDAWIALLCAAVYAIPVMFVYARIIRLYPGLDLYQIFEKLFGKTVGKILTALLVWYAIHLCALVLRDFSAFIQIVAMPETPQLPLMIIILFTVTYLVRSGVETMGRSCLVLLPIVLFVVVMTVLLAFNQMEFTNLMPVMEHRIGEIAASSYQILTFPFAESVLFLGLANALRPKDSPYKIFYLGLFISVLILLVVTLRNIVLLGVPMMTAEYFPSYSAARLIDVGDFLSRVEGSISMNFLFAGMIKISVCLLAASRGMARLFGLQDCRRIQVPVSLLVLALSAVLYTNVMELFDFLQYYAFYAIPFQFIIPFAVWIAAEIKTRINAHKNSEE